MTTSKYDIHNLLIPRYEVVIDYPESLYPVGTIIELNSPKADEEFFKKYSFIFKCLDWWDKRDLKFLPKYLKVLKHDNTTDYIEVDEWITSSQYFLRNWDNERFHPYIPTSAPFFKYKDKDYCVNSFASGTIGNRIYYIPVLYTHRIMMPVTEEEYKLNK